MTNQPDIQNAIAILSKEGYKVIEPEKIKEWEVFSIKKEGWSNAISSDKASIGSFLTGDLDSGWYIHSIKRLSDGQFFTVGDEIESKHHSYGTITSFSIIGDGLLRVATNTDTCEISWIRKRPDDKAPDSFSWNDSLVKEFVEGAINVQDSIPHDVSIETGMRRFKQSKLSLKKERIKVTEVTAIDWYAPTEKDGAYHVNVYFSNKVYKDKFPLIKQAIEEVLNEEREEIKFINYNLDVKYTRKELEEAFNAARLTHPLAGMKYDTFFDYINRYK